MNKSKLGEIITLQKGKKPKNMTNIPSEDFLPYIDIKAFEKGIIDTYADGEKCLSCEDGELLIVCDGSRSGLIGIAKKGYVGSTLAKINVDGITIPYLAYFLKGKYRQLNTNVKGTGTPHVNQELLKSFELFIPPLPEQNRIVEKLDELFSELDNGVETLQKIKELLKVYEQAVLKDAFSNVCIEMVQAKLGEFIEKPRYGTSKKCDYNFDENSTPVYRIPNIDAKTQKINYNDIKFATFTKDEVETLKLKKGDILIIRSNGSVSLVGRVAVISESDTHGLFAGYLMRLRIKENIELDPEYLKLYLSTHTARTYIEQTAKSTSGVNNINSTEISNLILPHCSLDEQKAIIEKIESRLSICDQIEKTVDESLQKAENLRQSILKQAFEGRLI